MTNVYTNVTSTTIKIKTFQYPPKVPLSPLQKKPSATVNILFHFPGYHINGIMNYVITCVLLLFLGIIHFRFVVYTLLFGSVFSCFLLLSSILLYRYVRNRFNNSVVVGLLDCFQFLAITNKRAAMKIHVQVFLFFLCKFLGVKLLGQKTSIYLTYKRYNSVFQSGYTILHSH